MENSQEACGVKPHAARASDAAVVDQFRAALVARDIIPPEPCVADGRLHRCNAAGARGRGDAAKAAENIARLVALFHMLDLGTAGTIDRACVVSAAQIVRWHLQEAHRLLGDLDAPPAMAAAIRLDAWLRDEAMRTGDGRIPTTRVYRYGPGCVRDHKDLKDAVALPAEHGRARLEEEGRRRFVVVNPALYAS